MPAQPLALVDEERTGQPAVGQQRDRPGPVGGQSGGDPGEQLGQDRRKRLGPGRLARGDVPAKGQGAVTDGQGDDDGDETEMNWSAW